MKAKDEQKLTVELEADLAQKAEHLAALRNVSVSELFEQLVNAEDVAQIIEEDQQEDT